jgi:hypothetical protein
MSATAELGRDACLADDALADAEAAVDALGQDTASPAQLVTVLELLTRVELRARGLRAQTSAHLGRQLGGPGTYDYYGSRIMVRRAPSGEWLVDVVAAP